MKRIVLILSASFVVSCGHQITETPFKEPIVVRPDSATLKVGESKIFDVIGGYAPLRIGIYGCYEKEIQNERCLFHDISYQGTFKFEKLESRRILITFLDAKLQPHYLALVVYDSYPEPRGNPQESWTYITLSY